MVFMVLSGLLQALDLALCKAISNWGYPLFFVIGISSGIIALGIACILFFTHAQPPNLQQGKWVVLRGVFSSLENLLVLIALSEGTPIGDIASLTSINVVIAAVLGRTLLNEPLGYSSLVAASLSLSGAALISKPMFLFGNADAVGISWMGYVLAAVAGFLQACKFIAARKAASVSVYWHVLGIMTNWAFLFTMVSQTNMFRNSPTTALTNSPVEATGILCSMVTIHVIIALLLGAGAKWCPVATSTTLNIASMMVCGYLVETLFFGLMPQLLTIIGSILMLSSVITMAAARTMQPSRTSAEQEEVVSVGDASDAVEVDLMEDIQSLTSFIAQEFVEVLPFPTSLRQRRGVNVSELPAEEIGLPGMVLVAAA